MAKMPICIMYDSGVDALERTAISSAVNSFVTLSDRKVYDLGVNALPGSDCVSVNCLLNSSMKVVGLDGIPRLDTNSLFALLANTNYDKPAILVFFTSMALRCENKRRSYFGTTIGRIVIQSVEPYRNHPNLERESVIRAAVQHELGRVFGAALDLRRSHTYGFGPYCANPNCIMGRFSSTDSLVKIANRTPERRTFFCAECEREIRANAALF